MDQVFITKASMNDLQLLRQLGKQTFFETFAESNTEANMNAYLAENFTNEKIKAELRNPESLFFIAWENDQAIGFLKLNTGDAQTEPQGESSLEIERIYVIKSFLGKKIGQLLYEKALQIARELHKSSIWLGVWEHNQRAIRFYEKNGFVPFDKHIFRVGDDDQTDIMMRKQVIPIP